MPIRICTYNLQKPYLMLQNSQIQEVKLLFLQSSKSNQIEITVSDNGIGMNRDVKVKYLR
jgi:HSP90 family molecular chaperone